MSIFVICGQLLTEGTIKIVAYVNVHCGITLSASKFRFDMLNKL